MRVDQSLAGVTVPAFLHVNGGSTNSLSVSFLKKPVFIGVAADGGCSAEGAGLSNCPSGAAGSGAVVGLTFRGQHLGNDITDVAGR
jgi:hypothetical protein